MADKVLCANCKPPETPCHACALKIVKAAVEWRERYKERGFSGYVHEMLDAILTGKGQT